MTKATSDILRRALELPRAERGRLVRELIASLDQGEGDDPALVERAWAEEIETRVRDLDEGRAKTVPGDKVLERLRAAQARDDKRERQRRQRPRG